MQLFDLVEHRSTADGRLIVIRRRGRAEESHSIARNYAIIRTLQTEVEDRLVARPRVYDGHKFLFTSSSWNSNLIPTKQVSHNIVHPPAQHFPCFLVCSAHE